MKRVYLSLLAALVLAASSALAWFFTATQDPCRTEPLGTVGVFLDETQPRYSRTFLGTIEAFHAEVAQSPARIVVRPDDGSSLINIHFRQPLASLRLPFGKHFRFHVDQAAGYPTVSGILMDDQGSLALAAASDDGPGRTVLREGVPGFQVEMLSSSCPSRPRGSCYESLRNAPLRFSRGGTRVELMHGEQADLQGYRIYVLTSQEIVYTNACADAGLIGLSYLIVRSDLVEGPDASVAPGR
ncbi:MAG: hypothetical protein HY436_01275 [Candidatus Liptonbacteria bacterium]|nr:hypothetical protein [Candidatus Liptonbacteria bacterium]